MSTIFLGREEPSLDEESEDADGSSETNSSESSRLSTPRLGIPLGALSTHHRPVPLVHPPIAGSPLTYSTPTPPRLISPPPPANVVSPPLRKPQPVSVLASPRPQAIPKNIPGDPLTPPSRGSVDHKYPLKDVFRPPEEASHSATNDAPRPQDSAQTPKKTQPLPIQQTDTKHSIAPPKPNPKPKSTPPVSFPTMFFPPASTTLTVSTPPLTEYPPLPTRDELHLLTQQLLASIQAAHNMPIAS